MKKLKGFDRIMWSIAFPGFGQILNGQVFKAVLFIFLEFLINTKSNINMCIFYSFYGDTGAAVKVLNYHWFLFYPCVYNFAIWDAFKCSDENIPDFMGIPFAASAIGFTIGVVFSPVLRVFGFLLGPIWLPIIFGLSSGFITYILFIRNSKNALSSIKVTEDSNSKTDFDHLNFIRIKDNLFESTLKNLGERISIIDKTGDCIKKSSVAKTDFSNLGSLFDQGKADFMYYDFDGNAIAYKQTPPFKVLKGIYVDAARIKILKNNLERYLLIWGIPIPNTKNEVIFGIFISIDVTEIKEKVFSNELQEKLFNTIIDYINQPIFFIDKEGNPIGCNEAGKKINTIWFDKDDKTSLKDRFQKAPIYDVYGRLISLEQTPSMRVVNGETFTKVPYIYRSLNNSIKYEVSGSPIHDEDGNLIFGIVHCHEISSILKSELETKAT